MMHMLGLVILVSMDNGIPMKPLEQIEFPSDCGIDWKKLDDQASTLHVDEAETFCCGEHDDMYALVKETGFEDLHNVLNLIFDGYLGEYFWATPPTEEPTQ